MQPGARTHLADDRVRCALASLRVASHPRSFRAHATAAGDHSDELTRSRPSCNLACSREFARTWLMIASGALSLHSESHPTLAVSARMQRLPVITLTNSLGPDRVAILHAARSSDRLAAEH